MTDGSIELTPWWWIVGDDGSGHVVDYWSFDAAEARRLLDALRSVVPKRTRADGGRDLSEPLHPDEIEEPHLKAAAMTLMLGELEQIASGPPESEAESWEGLLSNAELTLETVASKPVEKTRADAVALAEHLEEARERLKAIGVATAFARGEALNEDELAFVRSVQCETALNAFWLGGLMRAIDQKPFDEAARTGAKVQAGAKLGGAMARAPRKSTQDALQAMDAALADQTKRGVARSVARAAEHAFRNGLGEVVPEIRAGG
ncbi:MAG: hypothetical protein AAF763_10920 [Pseudomonadota bacterium]